MKFHVWFAGISLIITLNVKTIEEAIEYISNKKWIKSDNGTIIVVEHIVAISKVIS